MHCKKCLSANKTMSGNVYSVMIMSHVVVTFPQGLLILAVKKYALNVRNTLFYQVWTTKRQNRC